MVRSDGKYIRDYIYVRDASAAYVRVAEAVLNGLQGEAFNFSHEEEITVLEMIKSIQTVMSSDLAPVVLNEASGEIVRQHLDSSKARRLLSWRPAYMLEDALRETVAWYQTRLVGDAGDMPGRIGLEHR